MILRMRKLIPMLLLVVFSLPSFGWSQLGHAVIGDLAAQQLTPAARREVSRLLAGETEPTLGGIASWADGLRDDDSERARATAAWHFINASDGKCSFTMRTDCKDGHCIIAAVLEQQRILRERSYPPAARRDALKFLVHLIGDLHQPLHASNRPDAGGNEFQISLRTAIAPPPYARSSYRDGVMGTNLHMVWDYYILASAGLSRQEYVTRLNPSGREHPAKGAIATARSWAIESCKEIESRSLYPVTHVLDDAYLASKRKVAERRVRVAAARLAAVLNSALDDAPK